MNLALSPGIVYAVLATIVAVTLIITCYLDCRNTLNRGKK